jgi:3-oxoacyl-[acyl-carrier protein] reductase
MERKLEGKTAVVTGGSRGLGAAICMRLAQEGANVALTYVTSKEKAELLADELAAQHGVGAVAVRADVSNEADVRKLFRLVEDRFETAHVLVNNAGICPMSLIRNTTLETWERVMSVNMRGVFLTCREMVNHALAHRQEASIINIASSAAFIGSRNGKSHYAASKGGVVSFTVSLAKEVAGDHIRVNAVSPGVMYTDMTAELLDRDMEKYNRQIPMGRIARLDEIAAAVAFLAGQEASYMTGSVVDLSGGLCGR